MTGFDVVIVGGGAAGLMCAAQAARRGRKVVVLERTSKVGKKILMSGGGRCNFTNLYVEPSCYLSANPHFCKSALSRYTQWDFIGLVAQYGIPYHEKKLGQLFCDNSAQDILDMLLAECTGAGVTIRTQCDIQAVEHNQHFMLHTNQGSVETDTLIIASGGLSIPSMGVTGFGYEVAQQFGMNLLPTRAGLVPFTFTDSFKELSNRLSGLSVDVVLSNERNSFRENILFTHRGLSGPAVLQLSSYWLEGETVNVDLLPGEDVSTFLLNAKKAGGKGLLRNLLADKLPRKLVLELEALWWADAAEKPLADFSNRQLEGIAEQLQRWVLKPAGTEGYRTAEVTLGGVDTDFLSSKTMESKTRPGLFFIGEVVDVTGWLGGFNFQWAWASAYAAAQSV
ncbi:MAG: NAD(P)/FAD-dependent oxidoreductase [Pseudomonadota bacterium]